MDIVRYLKDKDGNRYKLEPPSDGLVPITRKVNNKPLSEDVTLTASDVNARPADWTPTASDVDAVPTTRTVNGKPLSADISLTASDVGALPASGGYVYDLNILQGLYLRNGDGANEGGEIHFDPATNSDLRSQYIDTYKNQFRFVSGLKDGRVTVFNLSMNEAVQADILHTKNISSKILPLNSTFIGLFSENENRAWIQANQYGAYINTVDGYLFFSRDGRDLTNRIVLHDASSGNDYAILHTANSHKVAIQSSAPTDTSSLWAW